MIRDFNMAAVWAGLGAAGWGWLGTVAGTACGAAGCARSQSVADPSATWRRSSVSRVPQCALVGIAASGGEAAGAAGGA